MKVRCKNNLILEITNESGTEENFCTCVPLSYKTLQFPTIIDLFRSTSGILRSEQRTARRMESSSFRLEKSGEKLKVQFVSNAHSGDRSSTSRPRT